MKLLCFCACTVICECEEQLRTICHVSSSFSINDPWDFSILFSITKSNRKKYLFGLERSRDEKKSVQVGWIGNGYLNGLFMFKCRAGYNHTHTLIYLMKIYTL